MIADWVAWAIRCGGDTQTILGPTMGCNIKTTQNNYEDNMWNAQSRVSFPAEVEFEFTTWAWVQGHCWNNDYRWQPLVESKSAVAAAANHHFSGGFFPSLINIDKQTNKMKIGSGLRQNSGGELKLYLGCTGSMLRWWTQTLPWLYRIHAKLRMRVRRVSFIVLITADGIVSGSSSKNRCINSIFRILFLLLSIFRNQKWSCCKYSGSSFLNQELYFHSITQKSTSTFYIFSLVSTHIVCERLSVMQE